MIPKPKNPTKADAVSLLLEAVPIIIEKLEVLEKEVKLLKEKNNDDDKPRRD